MKILSLILSLIIILSLASVSVSAVPYEDSDSMTGFVKVYDTFSFEHYLYYRWYDRFDPKYNQDPEDFETYVNESGFAIETADIYKNSVTNVWFYGDNYYKVRIDGFENSLFRYSDCMRFSQFFHPTEVHVDFGLPAGGYIPHEIRSWSILSKYIMFNQTIDMSYQTYNKYTVYIYYKLLNDYEFMLYQKQDGPMYIMPLEDFNALIDSIEIPEHRDYASDYVLHGFYLEDYGDISQYEITEFYECDHVTSPPPWFLESLFGTSPSPEPSDPPDTSTEPESPEESGTPAESDSSNAPESPEDSGTPAEPDSSNSPESPEESGTKPSDGTDDGSVYEIVIAAAAGAIVAAAVTSTAFIFARKKKKK